MPNLTLELSYFGLTYLGIYDSETISQLSHKFVFMRIVFIKSKKHTAAHTVIVRGLANSTCVRATHTHIHCQRCLS